MEAVARSLDQQYPDSNAENTVNHYHLDEELTEMSARRCSSF